MSLTSYQTAPPRVNSCGRRRACLVRPGVNVKDLSCLRQKNYLCADFLFTAFGRPGSDLLSHALRRSTIGAEAFHGRVRDGIGCIALR